MTSYETGEAARLFVIADAQGKILAAVRPPEAASVGVGAPTAVGIRPADGQALHEILLPTSLSVLIYCNPLVVIT